MPRTTTKRPTIDRLRRTDDIIATTGLSRRTLYRWAELGHLNIYKMGAATFWSLDELDSMIVRTRRSA